MVPSSLPKTELHVHLLQALYPEDVFELAKDIYKEIDWNRFGFLDRYESIYGMRISPIDIFERARKTGSLGEIQDVMIYGYSERGDFEKFNIKSHFPLCVTGYYLDRGDFAPVLNRIVQRHKNEGLSYVEYRQAVGYSEAAKAEWKAWHKQFVSFLQNASDSSFQAKYIMRISEDSYQALREFMEENPKLVNTIVGIDFTGREQPPKSHREFFTRLQRDNEQLPEQAIDAVVHIGEDFFDKSLESAIRWCHQIAEMGAKRLGHCIALGLDPAIAIARRPNAHQQETVSERLDQIEYDLAYVDVLRDFGVLIDEEKLVKERQQLGDCDSTELVAQEYDDFRLQQIRQRQDFVLQRFREMGTVIEVCPTSNLRIGGIPAFQNHPFHKFLQSGVNLAICTDDPGILHVSLGSETELVAQCSGLSLQELEEKIGNPYQYRLGQSRPTP